MTLEEVGKKYMISISYWNDNDGIGWIWSVEAGYQGFDSNILFKTAEEAERALKEFLLNWEGPTK